MYHHRSGSLKQTNKAHKTGGLATKRAIDRDAGGRVPGARLTAKAATSAAAPPLGQSKADTVNLAKQLAEQRQGWR